MAYHDDDDKEKGDVLEDAVNEDTEGEEDEDAGPDLGDVEEEKGWE